ncbi:Uracil DNA glycosylase superfamily protein [Photobacterium piscicola]|uniref:Uracil DNA glycosylase superfamily protein n=1 Tax=Photobacterium piscicola TaxID=1378299 RepID=A0A1T5I0K7_9GAMM|nr:uracil-DNA glycosylase family protein [Photobacterium piscicola]SKC32552.1 Uracil DNA glycosylase superfamily protein [Photobacterium piscicola]
MSRFFEVEVHTEGGLPPINTNFPNDGEVPIKIVIICESPSYDEVLFGFPSVSNTGTKIFNNLVRSGMLGSNIGDYSYETNYSKFAQAGIYLTNLVRYQADLGLKGHRAKKDKKVLELWENYKYQLFEELEKIHSKYPNSPVLIACGSAFKTQIIEVIKKVDNLGMPWFVTSHPSYSKKEYLSNYNPNKWNDLNIPKTVLMHSIENKLLRSS